MKRIVSFINSSVSRRILALFICCALLPIISLAAISLYEISGKLQQDTRVRLHHTSKNAGLAIHTGLSFLKTEMETLAFSLSRDLRENQLDSVNLDQIAQQKRLLSLTLFRGKLGGVTFFGKSCPLPLLTESAQAHLESSNALVYLERNRKALPRLFMAVLIEKNSLDRGLLVCEVNMDYLWEQVRYTLPPDTEISVLETQGAELYSSHPLLKSVAARASEGARIASSGRFVWTEDGNEFLSSYWSVFLKPSFHTDSWIVVVSQSKADAFSAVSRFIRIFLLILLVTLLTVSALGSVQIRRSFVPLAKLKEGTRLIRDGDFESRVMVTSGDEFQDLAVAFNEMSAQIGQQFNALTSMAQIVRSILTSLEKQKIVDTVAANLQNVIHCDIAALSLVENKANGPELSVINTTVSGEKAESASFLKHISSQELLRLQNLGETFLVESCDEFPSTISPVAKSGAKVFFLFPIHIKRELIGILTLGYRQQSILIREDLIRARQIADQIAVALENAGLVEELAQLNWGTLTALARAVDTNSPWTAGHSERVTELSLDIGRYMGLTMQELDILRKGALLHDIGKIGIPGYILDKPGKLTDEEYATIKEHPEKGAIILEPIAAYLEIVPIVAQHHEWFNGKGYPKGLKGETITLGARIIAVADVYDALVSDRPYRPGWELDRVVGCILESAGSQFDPRVVDAFMQSRGMGCIAQIRTLGIVCD